MVSIVVVVFGGIWWCLGSYSSVVIAAGVVARIRERLQAQTATDVNYWPGITEVLSMLSILNPNQHKSLPYTYHTVLAFHALFEKVLSQPHQYYRAQDVLIVKALQCALLCTADITSCRQDEVQNLVNKAQLALLAQVKQTPQLFLRKFDVDSESLTAAGHLEKLLITLDMETEKKGADVPGTNMRKAILQSDVAVDTMDGVLHAL
jgi:hypothetical protein